MKCFHRQWKIKPNGHPQNPASHDKYDQVFGKRSHTTTDVFSNNMTDDYFPNVNNILDDMEQLAILPNTANTNDFSSKPYTFTFHLFEIIL
jgi:hypothetical protein